MTNHVCASNAVISLGEVLEDGQRLAQIWHTCSCQLDKFRKVLGPPAEESFASPEAAAEIAAEIDAHPGLVRRTA